MIRRRRQHQRKPLPLTEEMLNELNKNHMSCADNTGTDSFYNDEVGDAWDHRTNFPTKPIKVHNPIFNFYSKPNETTAQSSFPRSCSLSQDRLQSALFISQIVLTAAAVALATITITTPTTITSGRNCTTRGNQNGTAVTMTLPILVRLRDRPRQHLPGPLQATVDTRLTDVHVLPISTTIFKNLDIFISLLPRENNTNFLFF